WACCSFRRGAAASPTIYSLSLHDALPIFLYFGILNQLRRMVWLTAGGDDDRAMAAPMLELHKAADTMNIVRRVASRKGDPNQVIDTGGRKSGVVAQDQQLDARKIHLARRIRKSFDDADLGFVISKRWSFYRHDARQC